MHWPAVAYIQFLLAGAVIAVSGWPEYCLPFLSQTQKLEACQGAPGVQDASAEIKARLPESELPLENAQ